MKKILVVVDFQNDFVSGSLGFAGASALDGRIAAKIAAYRADGWEIAFTMDTHGPDYAETQEGKKLPVPHCVRGTKGWELYGKVALCRRSADAVFEKPVFGSAALAEYLRKGGYGLVELVGLVSGICVISNAVLAKTALPEAEVRVDSACTAAADEQANREALNVMRGLQIDVF